MPKGVYDRHAHQGAEPCSPLAAARIAAGLTQAQLAQRVGVTMAVISNWERGLSRVGAKHLPALAEAIGFAPESPDARPEKEYPFPDFGAALCSMRERAGLKRGDVARRLGVTLPCYAGYELGKTLPPEYRIAPISALLGVSANELSALRNAACPPAQRCEMPFERFGQYLEACRRREALTRAHAAAQLGITYATYAQYERGAVLPPASRVPALAQLLGEPPDYLGAMRDDACGADTRRWAEAGKRLSDLHKESGLSRRQLAERSGVDGSTIYDYEHGRRNPANSPDTVARIAAALNVPPETIIGNCRRSDTGIGRPSCRRVDLSGRQFGRLFVTGLAYTKDRVQFWHCKCACGNTCTVMSERLLSGHTSSCGCLKASGVVGKRTIRAMDSYRVDGTYIHAIERQQPNKNNSTTGVRGVCYDRTHKTYKAFLRFRGKLHKREFTKLEDAIAYRKNLEDTLSKPAVEAFYAERNEHHDEQS